MTLLNCATKVAEDLEECRELMKKEFCSKLVDGDINESDITSFKAVESTIIHLSEAIKLEAALLTTIDNKLNALLEMKKD